MQLKNVTSLMVIVAVLFVAGGRALAASYTWTGGAGNGNWTNAVNWDPGVPPNNGGHTVVFDNGLATTTNKINHPTARPIQMNFRFVSGARSYNFNDDYIDNSGNANLSTELGMTNDQVFTGWRVGTSSSWTLDGSGDITISDLWNNNTWDLVNGVTFTATITNDAVLNIGGYRQIRRITTTKNGPGKMVFTGTIEHPYGTNAAGGFISSSNRINSGSVDISAATLKLINKTSGNPLKAGQVYTIMNYSNATLVSGASYASVSDVPPGWEVFHDAANYKIVLREGSGRPKGTIVQIR
jgi:fibronectin-binding autotransporter adhesin